MEFQKKLKKYFKDKGISNKSLEPILGYSDVMISRYLNTNKPNYDFIMAVVKSFPDVDLNYLFKDNLNDILNEENQLYEKNEEQLIDEIEINLNKLRLKMTQNRNN